MSQRRQTSKVVGYQVQVATSSDARQTPGTVRTETNDRKLLDQATVDRAAGRLVPTQEKQLSGYPACWLETIRPSVWWSTEVLYEQKIRRILPYIGHLCLDAPTSERFIYR